MYLAELAALEKIIASAGPQLRTQQHGSVTYQQHSFPLYSLQLGSHDPAAPVIGFFGGVHGLERIGSQILIAFLHSLLQRLKWDRSLQYQLESLRMVFMPIINPIGMALSRRANGNGVDLMRNAPMDADGPAAFLVGGHRISRHLPWFRGLAGAAMESENQALCAVVQEQLLTSPLSIALDCHSGFGLRDRIWFPYAATRQPMPQLAEVYALQQLLNQCYPHHPYVIEPQARQYCTHGDVWDYLLHTLTPVPALQSANQSPHARIFLPLTLELGSWLWIKKNPRQFFSIAGFFNPLVAHRQRRVLRRHLPLLEFLIRATHDYRSWLPQSIQRMDCQHAAIEQWYRQDRP